MSAAIVSDSQRRYTGSGGVRREREGYAYGDDVGGRSARWKHGLCPANKCGEHACCHHQIPPIALLWHALSNFEPGSRWTHTGRPHSHLTRVRF
jgi:hypothetical protein